MIVHWNIPIRKNKQNKKYLNFSKSKNLTIQQDSLVSSWKNHLANQKKTKQICIKENISGVWAANKVLVVEQTKKEFFPTSQSAT